MPQKLIPAVTHGASALARDLAQAIEGEVRFDAGSRSLYATDASNYRQVPIGVVLPRTTQEVIKTVELCRHHGGAGCSRAGAGRACAANPAMPPSSSISPTT